MNLYKNMKYTINQRLKPKTFINEQTGETCIIHNVKLK